MSALENFRNIWMLILLVLPLLSSLVTRLIGKKGSVNPGIISATLHSAGLLSALYLSVRLWDAGAFIIQIPWLLLGENVIHANIDISLLVDRVSLLMVLVVYLISTVVQWFSVYYMEGDEGFRKYFVYLGAFTFSMLGIVLSGNLLFTFMCWELVGFASYLLIGFWFSKPSAAYAGKKAFMVNRIGDLGFIIALMILWSGFGTFEINEIGEALIEDNQDPVSTFSIGSIWIAIAGFGLFAGASGKSAQFPLLVWLPDAMEGPTPVSALIHAATMVAAGIYLLFRVFVILTIPVLDIIVAVGTLTAFMASVAALTQYDIKKVLAFSTISQLGFMMIGIGTGFREAAIFHLFTHAFFKAGLFLAAGVIIKSIHEGIHASEFSYVNRDVQDMRYMGGLGKSLPWVFVPFLIFSASLVGLPFFSGFLSKDTIISGAIAWGIHRSGFGILVPLLVLITAFLTVIYIGRAIILTFLGNSRMNFKGQPGSRQIKPNLIPFLSLVLLSLFSLGIVFSVNPFSVESSWIFQSISITPASGRLSSSFELNRLVSSLSGEYHLISGIISMGIIVAGAVVSYMIFRPEPGSIQANDVDKQSSFLRRLSFYNWYLDRLYDRFLAIPFYHISLMGEWIDRNVIDKFIDGVGIWNVVMANVISWFDRNLVDGLVNMSARLTGLLGRIFRVLHRGNIQGYYIWLIFILMFVLIFWVV